MIKKTDEKNAYLTYKMMRTNKDNCVSSKSFFVTSKFKFCRFINFAVAILCNICELFLKIIQDIKLPNQFHEW